MKNRRPDAPEPKPGDLQDKRRLEGEAPDWHNATAMIQSAMHPHPVQTIEEMAAEINRLYAVYRQSQTALRRLRSGSRKR